MPRRTVIASLVNCFILLSIACSALAQQAGQGAAPAERRRPGPAPLFFREDWKTVPGLPVEHPVSQAAIANPNLELKLYGAASKDIQENGAPNNEANPLHVWTGLCEGPCALTFRDKSNYVDLTGAAKIRWHIKVSGFHQVRPLIKLADGTVLVGDHTDGTRQRPRRRRLCGRRLGRSLRQAGEARRRHIESAVGRCAVIDRAYSVDSATVGAVYDRPIRKFRAETSWTAIAFASQQMGATTHE
ncbi:MAG: hypothetical protein AUH28_07120 [Acidobacteria bacterium 13_1_40CM_56_16]|nr:MAG: hypothetical protein AUH28_07120 [Acidobacteria bacterium 13_1_40CM_56_16]